MSVTYRIRFAGLLAVVLCLTTLKPAAAEDESAAPVSKLPPASSAKDGAPAKKAEAAQEVPPASAAATKKPAPAAKPVRKVKQLSQDMAGRRDRVRRLLKALREQPFNTQQNNCADVLEFCRGFGCDANLLDNAGSGQKLNGITCLCWNMPCGGQTMMSYSEGRIAPRVGYGFQSQPSEFAAILAQADVPIDYPARVGRIVRTVADLIEYEKLTCRSGADMSLKLVALAHYVQDPSWKDNRGGEWTLRRVVSEELSRPAGEGEHAATNRLLGLVAAINRFEDDKAPLDGDLAQAKSYVEESTAYALSSQNADGSWGRATNRDYATTVSATADMLDWLIASEPERGLEDAHIVQAIDFLTNTFNSQHYQAYISMMNAREVAAAMHAAYVLNIYDQRVFAPADPLPETAPAKVEKAEQNAAASAAQTR